MNNFERAWVFQHVLEAGSFLKERTVASRSEDMDLSRDLSELNKAGPLALNTQSDHAVVSHTFDDVGGWLGVFDHSDFQLQIPVDLGDGHVFDGEVMRLPAPSTGAAWWLPRHGTAQDKPWPEHLFFLVFLVKGRHDTTDKFDTENQEKTVKVGHARNMRKYQLIANFRGPPLHQCMQLLTGTLRSTS